MVVTSDPEIAEAVRLLHVHGARTRYHHERIGTNSRLDALQAAILLAKLPHLDEWNEKRRRNAAYYEKKLAGLDGVQTPYVAPENVSVYHVYTIRAHARDKVAQLLDKAGIGRAIHYPVPLPLQKALDYLGYEHADVPQSVQASKEVLSIPMYPELTQEQMDEVVSAISNALREA
jgi:dTDP-4-amino-4,6-dideoxygalactose transaminase